MATQIITDLPATEPSHSFAGPKSEVKVFRPRSLQGSRGDHLSCWWLPVH